MAPLSLQRERTIPAMTDATVKMYAIAARDDELRLFRRIARRRSGIFVLWPRDDTPGWNPHASYHADGHYHHKGHDFKSMEKLRQKPDDHFQGNENITTVGIASGEVSAMEPLVLSDFSAVFEIPISELKPQMYHTNVSVDLTDTSAEPIITSRHVKILRKMVFDDAYPWIVATLFDTCPDSK